MKKELEDYIKEALPLCSARAVFVIEHIMKHGSIDADDLVDAGFVHGARAIGDVRDQGIPLTRTNIKGLNNRTIGEYRFGSASEIKRNRFGGRITFPSSLKKKLIERDGLVCSISGISLSAKELQIDHRIPYFISGDILGVKNPDDFMLLSSSMQRTKSWDCENCENIKNYVDLEICRTCYWAYPENYSHVAMRKQRSMNLVWEGDEVDDFDKLVEESTETDCSPQTLIKGIVKQRYKS